MEITEEKMNILIESQQGELDGVETYLRMAEAVSNQTDAETFKRLAADEGRHASVFKKYTNKVLSPNTKQANMVVILYRLLGKRIMYPLIAKGEYSAIAGYEKIIDEFPEVESVKNDEKRHGDTVKSLLDNGEYNDKPLLPIIAALIFVCILIRKLMK
ncbi:MAG: rubrerythrin [Lachnospiraceae bacterium]|nr:rubrerythrin [Lachnospiraceae bacterium]MDN4745376.1 ferritin family protein [Lachnospiraceae bacterium C1.1]